MPRGMLPHPNGTKKRQIGARNWSGAGIRSRLVPTFKILTHHLSHPHLHVPWAARTNERDGELGHLVTALRTLGQAIGWAVLIVFGTWMVIALGFALVHVMNFWSSPGAP